MKSVKKGIESHPTKIPFQVIASEKEAFTYAIDHAQKDSLIVLCCDDIEESTQVVKSKKKKMDKGKS